MKPNPKDVQAMLEKYLDRGVSIVFMETIEKMSKSTNPNNNEVDAAVGRIIQEVMASVSRFSKNFLDYKDGKLSKVEAAAKMGGMSISDVEEVIKKEGINLSEISISKDLGL